jgi:hypothetical protein
MVPLERSLKHPSSSEGRVRRRSPLGHGARSGSSLSAPAKQRMPLPWHMSHEGWDKHAPWPRNTLDPILWGPGDAQLEQLSHPVFRPKLNAFHYACQDQVSHIKRQIVE